ncbi:target of rapamycin complex subunit lst8-like isoform X2 [Ostrea edulis]|uniref:target of rapamycin complex subunit lst8-like isoform X2 n=1 Tax=Ostrea edulis TaxID=37623 RepID=UPI002094621C|nr:target of rapamycin complex subunit lst8-like isoform X2 [Ostrea edulis]
MSQKANSDPVVLATAGYDHTIRFWQAHTGICYRTVQHPDSQVNALEITPDKQMIAAAGYQHIRMYDLNSDNPNPVVNYDGIQKNVTSVGFHEEGKWMYTGGEDNTVRIWDLRTRSLQCQRIFQANAPVNCVCLHPNQGEIFVGDQSGRIHIWDLKKDSSESLTPQKDASIQSISIDPMGTMMAAINNKGVCYIWTLSGGRGTDPVKIHLKKTFEAHSKYGIKCLFSPDSTLLATTSADQTCKIWRTADHTLMTELKENTQRWVWDCAFSGDSQYIITASSDNMARLWSVESGDVKKEYSGHQKAVVCLAFRDEFVQ